jgi:hypothetical protein
MNKVQKMYVAWRNGIKYPYQVMQVCDEVGLPFYAACAVLEKESSGGSNVFGHDPTIFVGAGRVTKKKYLAYKAERKRTGKMQGVGPCQLTWYAFQDQADALGGCWKPKNNMRVGFGLLKEYREDGHTWEEAGTLYNGGKEYGRDFALKVQRWVSLFA